MPAEPPLPARRGMPRRGHLTGRVRPSRRSTPGGASNAVCVRPPAAGRPSANATDPDPRWSDFARYADLQHAVARFEAAFERRYGLCLNEGMTLCTLSRSGAALPGGAGRTAGTDPLEHLESAPRRRIQRTREARTGLCGPPANVLLADRGRACAAGRARLPGGGDSPAAAGAARRVTAAAKAAPYPQSVSEPIRERRKKSVPLPHGTDLAQIPLFRPRRHADRLDAGHRARRAVRPAPFRNRRAGPRRAQTVPRSPAARLLHGVLRHEPGGGRPGGGRLARIFRPAGHVRERTLSRHSGAARRHGGRRTGERHRHVETPAFRRTDRRAFRHRPPLPPHQRQHVRRPGGRPRPTSSATPSPRSASPPARR